MALTKVTRGVLGVILLIFSNGFMNTAWYLHLKFENWSMAKAIFISWSIALPEYSLQVPANRISHVDHGGPFTAPQLKVIAEVCSLTTFAIFSTLVLKEKLRWVDLGAFALIFAGVLLSLLTKPAMKAQPPVPPPLPPPPAAGEVPQAEVQLASGGRKMLMLGDGNTENGAESEVRVRIAEESKPHGGASIPLSGGKEVMTVPVVATAVGESLGTAAQQSLGNDGSGEEGNGEARKKSR